MIMRLPLIALLALSAVASQASFDLMLIGDNGDNTTFGRKIHRYDPVTGAYLGSFGNFSTPIRHMAIDRTNKRVAVLGFSTVQFYDYNNGNFLFETNSVGARTIRLNAAGTHFIVANQTGRIWRADLNYAVLNSIIDTTGTFTSVDAIMTPDGSVLAYGLDDASGNPRFSSFTPSGALDYTTTYASGFSWHYGMCFSNYAGTRFSTLDTYTATWMGQNTVVNGVWNVASYSSLTGLNSTASHGLAAAHDGTYVYGLDALGAQRVVHYSAFGSVVNSFTLSQVQNFAAMDTFLAPEPGTWAALGLGAITLMRRRRR